MQHAVRHARGNIVPDRAQRGARPRRVRRTLASSRLAACTSHSARFRFCVFFVPGVLLRRVAPRATDELHDRALRVEQRRRREHGDDDLAYEGRE